MSKFFKWIKTISVAMINTCLLCGAGHVFDWMGFVFKRTTHATRKIKRFVLNNIPSLNNR
jgi:hypothetical protein